MIVSLLSIMAITSDLYSEDKCSIHLEGSRCNPQFLSLYKGDNTSVGKILAEDHGFKSRSK